MSQRTSDKSHPGNSYFAPSTFIEEGIYLTKYGEMVVHLHLDGIDFECLTHEQMERLHNKLEQAILLIPDEVRFMSYLIHLDGAEIQTQGNIDNEIVQHTVMARSDFLQDQKSGAALVSNSTPLVLVYEPSDFIGERGPNFLKITKRRVQQMKLVLMNALQSFAESVGSVLGITVFSRQEVFTFLRFLASLDPEIAASERLEYNDHIDSHMLSRQIRSNEKGLWIDGMWVDVLSMRKPPRVSYPHLWREFLTVRCNFVVCVQFKKMTNEKALSKIRSVQEHFYWVQFFKDPKSAWRMAWNKGATEHIIADKAATARVKQMDMITKRVDRGDYIGEYLFTAIVFDFKNPNRQAAGVLQFMKIMGSHLGSLVREIKWAFGAYMSIFPGRTPKWGNRFRKRKKYFPGSQFVDMAFFWNHRKGSKTNPLTGKPALVVLQTNDRTPYYFNLVPPGGNRKSALIVGEPGSGKTTFAQMCIDHGMKDGTRVFILDGLGSSYRNLTKKHGGAYFELNPDATDDKKLPFSLNPFQVMPDSIRSRQYLSMLIRTCMASSGFKGSALNHEIIYNEVARVMSKVPFKDRRISELNLGEKMRPYLSPWVGEGPYSFVFDNDVDNFTLSHFQTIDFSALMDYKDMVQPLLFHFFWSWNKVIYDPTLLTVEKDMFVDEGWDLLDYPAARRFLKVGWRTMRKRLGGLILMTQSIEELKEKDMMKLVNELCSVKILLSSPNSDVEEYGQLFKLNSKECEHFAGQQDPGHGMYLSAAERKPFRVVLSPVEIAEYGNDPYLNEFRERSVEKYGRRKGIEMTAEMITEQRKKKVG